MKSVYCPVCKRLLFKANVANLETKCGSCKRVIRVRFYTQESLLLTPEKEEDNIKVVENIEEKSSENNFNIKKSEKED